MYTKSIEYSKNKYESGKNYTDKKIKPYLQKHPALVGIATNLGAFAINKAAQSTGIPGAQWVAGAATTWGKQQLGKYIWPTKN